MIILDRVELTNMIPNHHYKLECVKPTSNVFRKYANVRVDTRCCISKTTDVFVYHNNDLEWKCVVRTEYDSETSDEDVLRKSLECAVDILFPV